MGIKGADMGMQASNGIGCDIFSYIKSYIDFLKICLLNLTKNYLHLLCFLQHFLDTNLIVDVEEVET